MTEVAARSCERVLPCYICSTTSLCLRLVRGETCWGSCAAGAVCLARSVRVTQRAAAPCERLQHCCSHWLASLACLAALACSRVWGGSGPDPGCGALGLPWPWPWPWPGPGLGCPTSRSCTHPLFANCLQTYLQTPF